MSTKEVKELDKFTGFPSGLVANDDGSFETKSLSKPQRESSRFVTYDNGSFVERNRGALRDGNLDTVMASELIRYVARHANMPDPIVQAIERHVMRSSNRSDVTELARDLEAYEYLVRDSGWSDEIQAHVDHVVYQYLVARGEWKERCCERCCSRAQD